MGKLYFVCVDDQREVLNALTEDLGLFEKYVFIEECESANEAWALMQEIDSKGDHVAVVLTDQVMPEKSGVDLLKTIHEDLRFLNTRKVLLTGLATHQDTIEAINGAELDNYVEKPWNKESLHNTLKVLITKYVVKAGIDYQRYLPLMDQKTLYTQLRSLA